MRTCEPKQLERYIKSERAVSNRHQRRETPLELLLQELDNKTIGDLVISERFFATI